MSDLSLKGTRHWQTLIFKISVIERKKLEIVGEGEISVDAWVWDKHQKNLIVQSQTKALYSAVFCEQFLCLLQHRCVD